MFQSAFAPNRLITDNAIIAFETFHYMRKKRSGKVGYVGLKLDMAKAYDRIEWPFLHRVLVDMGFPCYWVNLIMKCVSSVSFSILINGNPSPSFYPKRGLRQGDPLSPYLFILCAKVLSGLILKSQERRALHGICIARSAPEISHLFFADDSILFFRANKAEADEVLIKVTFFREQLIKVTFFYQTN